MRSDINYANPVQLEIARNQIEQLFYAPTPTPAERVSTALQQFGTRLFHWLVADNTPKIRSYTNRSGQALWRVHDPVNGQAKTFDSEENLRVWLEQRYYH